MLVQARPIECSREAGAEEDRAADGSGGTRRWREAGASGEVQFVVVAGDGGLGGCRRRSWCAVPYPVYDATFSRARTPPLIPLCLSELSPDYLGGFRGACCSLLS